MSGSTSSVRGGQGGPGTTDPTGFAQEGDHYFNTIEGQWRWYHNGSWQDTPGGGGGAVSSVSNSDGSLTINPVTGAVVASLNVGHANSWVSLQTFGNNISLGGAQLSVAGLANGNIIQYNGANWVNVTPASIGAGVTTVSNADGTLTISPTSGAVVASLNLSNANTWLATQQFQEIDPRTDNTYNIGTSSLRWANVNSGNFIVWGTQGPANAMLQAGGATNGGQIQFGPGGATAFDIQFLRTGGTTLTVQSIGVNKDAALIITPTGSGTASLNIYNEPIGTAGARLQILGNNNSTLQINSQAVSAGTNQPIVVSSAGVEAFRVTIDPFVNLAVQLNTHAVAPATDNTYPIGSPSLRYTDMDAQSFSVYTAAGDANVVSQLSGAGLVLGAGGATATDAGVSRASATQVNVKINSVNGINFQYASGVPKINFAPSGTSGTLLVPNNTAGSTQDGALTIQTHGGSNRWTVDSSGVVSMIAKMALYNNISTQGIGVVPVFKFTSQKSETAADANVLTYTPPAVAGSYRVHVWASCSAASAASGFGFTLAWTDSNAHAQSAVAIPIWDNTTGTLAATQTLVANAVCTGFFNIDINNAAANIVVGLVFAGTSFTAKVSASVEQIN